MFTGVTDKTTYITENIKLATDLIENSVLDAPLDAVGHFYLATPVLCELGENRNIRVGGGKGGTKLILKEK